ncbi:hypothetical protein EfmAA242_26080 [Enterococcus faecium]|nr:hypothetical protein EfmAA242_26080 [Enterococcus faecium]
MAKTTTVTTFDNISTKRISFNFKNATNAISTDCNGQLDGETEMQRNCIKMRFNRSKIEI